MRSTGSLPRSGRVTGYRMGTVPWDSAPCGKPGGKRPLSVPRYLKLNAGKLRPEVAAAAVPRRRAGLLEKSET